jgi:dihydrofolate reductase
MRSRRPAVTVIAAVARNGVIGRDNRLAWPEPEDLKHFRRATLGHPVLMGRRTWDSLPARFRPLPGRLNLVLTRDREWRAEGATAVASLDESLKAAGDAERIFVIGGAEAYALALPVAETLVLTEIDADLVGDTHFPNWDRARFRRVDSDARLGADGTAYRFTTYQRQRDD